MTIRIQHWLIASVRSPAIVALAFLCGGILLGGAGFEVPDAMLYALLALTLLTILAASRFGKPLPVLVSACGLFFILGFTGAHHRLTVERDWRPSPGKRTIHATVDSLSASGPKARVFFLRGGVDTGIGQNLPGLGRLLLRDTSPALGAGDRIAFQARIRTPRNRGNPGEFDWETHCLNNGVYWLTSLHKGDGAVLLQKGSRYDPRVVFSNVRESVRRFIEANSSGDVRAALKGLVLGDRGELTDKLQDAFSTSGLAHLLSASGLHVGIVALFVGALVSLAALPFPQLFLVFPYKKLTAALVIPAILTYCFLVGARIPAMRATIMGLVVAVAILADRKWLTLNSLAIAALILLSLYPLSLYSIGFQLSFGAVLGILLLVGPWMERLNRGRTSLIQADGDQSKPVLKALETVSGRWSRNLASLVMTTFAATLAVSPILAKAFHVLPTYGLVANLAAAVPMTLGLSTALLASGVGTVWPYGGKLILGVSELLIGMVISIATFFSGLPNARIHLARIDAWEVVVGCASAVTLLWLLANPSRKRIPAIVLCATALGISLVWAPWIRSGASELEVVFLNVGKSDAAFVRPPTTHGFLIDSGVRTAHFDAGRAIVRPFLTAYGVRALDGVILSHPEMDHMGGLPSVIENTRVYGFWWNHAGFLPDYLSDILDILSTQGASIHAAGRSEPPIKAGNATIEFLNLSGDSLGTPGNSHDVNNSSAVCRVRYGRISMLFTGDMEAEAENQLATSGLSLRSTVLKVAHHGCATSSTDDFIKKVRPRIAVISCHDFKPASCPDDLVMQRLEAVTERVFVTGRDGAIIIKTDGKEIRAQTGRGELIRFQ